MCTECEMSIKCVLMNRCSCSRCRPRERDKHDHNHHHQPKCDDKLEVWTDVVGDTGQARLNNNRQLSILGDQDVNTQVSGSSGNVTVVVSHDIPPQNPYTFNISDGLNTTTIDNGNTVNVSYAGYQNTVSISPVVGNVANLTLTPNDYFVATQKNLQESVGPTSNNPLSEFIMTDNSVFYYDEPTSRFYLDGGGHMSSFSMTATISADEDFPLTNGNVGFAVYGSTGALLGYSLFTLYDYGSILIGKQTINLNFDFREPEWITVNSFNTTNTNIPLLLENAVLLSYPNMKVSIRRYAS